MKKIFAILITSVLLFNSISLAFDLSSLMNGVNNKSQESSSLTAVYLDTVATFDVPDKWVYEGVILDEKYSQKKYTYIKNLDVSVLYGLRDLDQEIKKTMPFLSAESLLSTMSEQNLVDIIASASESEVVEKMYGKNKFYEFEKTQQVTDGGAKVDVHSIIDMCIIDSNIFSFSYSYRDKKDALQDYEKMLVSFRLKNSSAPKEEPTKNVEEQIPQAEPPKVIEETATIKEVKAPEAETKQEENKVEEVVDNKETEIKEDEKTEENTKSGDVKSEETATINDLTSEINQEAITERLSGNNEEKNNFYESEPIAQENEEEPQPDEIGVVIKRNEKKNFFQTILSVIGSNTWLVCLLIGFVVIDIVCMIISKKKKKKKEQENKKSENAETVDKTEK